MDNRRAAYATHALEARYLAAGIIRYGLEHRVRLDPEVQTHVPFLPVHARAQLTLHASLAGWEGRRRVELQCLSELAEMDPVARSRSRVRQVAGRPGRHP